MVIVAGHITVEPQQRESYLTGWVSIAEQARRAADRAMTDEIGAAVRSYRTTTKATRRDLRP